MTLERCEPARHIFFAIPSYTFHPSASTLISLCRAIGAFCEYKISWTIKVEPQNAYVDDVRNILVDAFLKSPATDMVFIDDDIAAREEDFIKLAWSRYPVVGGAYRKKCQDMLFTVGFDAGLPKSDDGHIQAPIAEDGAVEVDYLPTGFLRINRAVFAAMPVEVYEGIDGNFMGDYFVSGRQVRNGRRMHTTEDVDFCRRWRALGGKVYMIPNMTFDHIGVQSFSGNWAEWQAEQAKS
jgi:hypothetical protein